MREDSINNVVVVSGTHGNEYTGVFLYHKWQHHPELVRRDSFNTQTLLANPQAVKANRRYLDTDLNRCFQSGMLNDFNLTGHEADHAKVINQEIGPKGNAQADFILDLHTSTANMGINLVLTKLDEFHIQLAKFLIQLNPEINVTVENSMGDDHHFLCSIAERHAIIEIGPVPQGIYHHQTILDTETTSQHVLDFIEQFNNQTLPDLDFEMIYYRYLDPVFYPKDSQGQINAVIHQSIQGKDFSVLHKDTPMFECFSGDVIHYQGHDRYISFVNEAAYYDKGIAFHTLEQLTI